MPINTIQGSSGADSLAGTAAADLISGFTQGGGIAANTAVPRIATGFSLPTFATAPPDDTSRLFVTEKNGQIEILDLATSTRLATPFLDLTGTLTTASEQGLLGMAFDPDYAGNGVFYLHVSNAAGDSEIRRYHVDPGNPNRALAASELILQVDQPTGLTNHKGGWIGFGPDGLLYVSLGDGGGGGDPFNNAQNTSSLLGKMLRLDVSGADAFPADPLRNYAIPAGNPFAGATPGADEIYAYGLRNAWRDSFDRGTGDFFIADVGQGNYEEVNLGAAGANFGWRLYEGNTPYNGGGPTAGLTFPIFAYDHSQGDASITGGYVYRGPNAALHSAYVSADYVSGRIRTIDDLDGDGVWMSSSAYIPGLQNISSLAEDAEGRLYAMDIGDGELYRIDPGSSRDDAADTLDGFDGDDRLYAGGGADTARGGAGNDSLSGMAGDDLLAGGDGADTIMGGDGNDTLFGEAGADHLAGAAGADELDGGEGPDTLSGGTGDDRLVVRDLGDILFELPGGGQDSAFILVQGYTLPEQIEIAYLRGAATVLTGSAGAEQLVANGGGSQLFGMGGQDVLWGSALADTLEGGAGDDILRGQGGADSMAGGAGDDQFVLFDAGAVVVELPGEGTDTAWVAASGWTMGANIEIGRLAGSANSLTGSAGADQLVANSGAASSLRGGGGDDTLWSSGLADTLDGGTGDDILYSNGGADRFLFTAPGWGFDQVAGFDRAAGAKLVLSGLGTDYATISAGLTFGGGNTQINLGGDRVLVYGVTGLLESDFIF